MSARRRKSGQIRFVGADIFELAQSGALFGDELLAGLSTWHGFYVRLFRFGADANAGLHDQHGFGRIPPAPLLYAFSERQPQYLEALLRLHAPAALPSAGYQPFLVPEAKAVERARMLLGRLAGLGFRAHLNERGALLISDALGMRRDLSRFISIADTFDTLVEALAQDPDLLNSPGFSGAASTRSRE